MNVVLTNSEETSSTLKIIFEELSIIPSDYGTEVKLIKGNGPLKIISSEKKVTIYYKEIPHLFRGLTQWCNRIGENFSLVEAPQFESIGPMIDLSRNAVMSIPALKRFITLCSKMGLNSIMLYMEDVYSIPEYPFFGYSRGKYSQEELKELDSFSQLLGVELIPAIQTLAHLANPLKWRFANGIKDTEDILLVGAPETYTFLNAAIKSIADTFHTKKIHIGMDEAHNLGRGHYLDEHGLEDPFNIMRKHLSEVKKICDTYELSPMMWSDMFFRIGSASGDYYDLDVNFPDSLVNDIPDIDMVYWDYYHHKTQEYDQQIKNHKLLKRPIIFAGGIWTFNGLAPNYGKTIETTQAGLESAKKKWC
jgi:hexosaminidase